MNDLALRLDTLQGQEFCLTCGILIDPSEDCFCSLECNLIFDKKEPEVLEAS